jgi:MrfA Zn-binding domain
MSPKRARRPQGQIRQSQLITSFGPGAMLDLPNYSVLIAGLEYWSPLGEEIAEPRLSEKLCQLLSLPSIQLRIPPPDQEDPTAPPTGINAWQFPEWFITQSVSTGDDQPTTRARMLVHRRELSRGQFIDDDKKKRSVVPIRFVRACRAGHIGDIDWYAFSHNGPAECRRRLWIDERGTSGDLAEVWIRCECGKERTMAQAAKLQERALGNCDGSRPWLGQYTKETCGEPSRMLIRTASNAYFPQKVSVISLPARDETVKMAVNSVWEFLAEVEDVDMLRYERKKARVNAALEGITDEEVFSEIKARRGATPGQTKTIKQAELETLISSREEIGEDRPDGNFFARTLLRDRWDRPWMQPIERVVLVQRLREVVALVGFTRFEAMSPDIQGELEMGVRRAALARETTWLPVIENKGEGVFLQFRRDTVESWVTKTAVRQHGRGLDAGFNLWREEQPGTRRQFPGLPYLMLHSFSHLLITAVSLECGYPASSIRERIYSLPGVGYGVLLHTGTIDAEGTLGGLVQVGRRIHEHIRRALEMGELCSNDPVCSQHNPENRPEHRFLHGAACHGCVLIAETSCEQQNDFLDRGLVVPTLSNLGVNFFPWPPA